MALVDLTKEYIINKIKAKLKEILLHDTHIYTKFEKSQRTFLANVGAGNKEIDLVNGGICWGISAKWCQRWVGDKKGFKATKKYAWTLANFFDDVPLDPTVHATLDPIRFQKKSNEMFVLMQLQNTAGESGGALKEAGGRLALAMRMHTPQENVTKAKNYNILQGNKKIGTTPLKGPNEISNVVFKSTQRDKHYDNANDYINKAVAKYADLFLDPRDYFEIKRTGKIDYCDGAQERVLSSVMDQIITSLDNGKYFGAHPVAFIVSWRAPKSGHAMASAYDQQEDLWYFMDPNYGEWRGTQEYIRKIIALLASLYSLTANRPIQRWATQRLRHI
jgi:hypothetical protein